MREIKFRAWEKTSESMVYDVQNVSGKRIIGESACESFQEVLDSWEYEVMQYTGLIDKNGREFFEGDIITWQDKPIFSDSEKSEKLKDIIVFEDGCFRTKIYNELLSNLARIEKTGFKFNYLTHHETEIIGNIYENPELLGG